MVGVEVIHADSPAVRRELAACLGPMIGQLPPLYREAVRLVDLEGLPQQEAAARTGITLSGMKSRVQRGRQALKAILVECCPVHLDAGGRIVDYDRPGTGCTTCAGSGEVAALVEDPGNGLGRCCTPPVPRAGEIRALDVCA